MHPLVSETGAPCRGGFRKKGGSTWITKLRASNTCSERGRTRTHTDERGMNYLSACTDRCLVADVVLCVGAEANADPEIQWPSFLRLPPHQRREQSSACAGPFRTSATRHRSVPAYSRVNSGLIPFGIGFNLQLPYPGSTGRWRLPISGESTCNLAFRIWIHLKSARIVSRKPLSEPKVSSTALAS
jgi:hypothetical protein